MVHTRLLHAIKCSSRSRHEGTVYEINFVEIFVIMFHTSISIILKNKVGKYD